METLNQEITEVIKSFEDAAKVTNRPTNLDFPGVPEDMLSYLIAHYKMAVITEALNQEWKADWNDSNQEKWVPWFHNAGVSSGFAFYGMNCHCSIETAGGASRLCFKTEALAEYAGKLFVEIWNDILMG